MPLTFAGTLDRGALLRAADALVDLVAAPEVAEAWERESALPGMTVGGVTRHLVSQPECAVEFLRIQPVPPHAPRWCRWPSCYERTDWFARRSTPRRTPRSATTSTRWPRAGRRTRSRSWSRRWPTLPGAVAAAGADDVRAVAGLLPGHRRLPRRPADGGRGARRRPRRERRSADAGVRRRRAAPGARAARDAGARGGTARTLWCVRCRARSARAAGCRLAAF